ncbi:MAG: hypothetical protein ACR2PW_01190 [Gammaproteobacteria bacterium]
MSEEHPAHIATDILFLFARVPASGARHGGIDAALAAAAIERRVCLLFVLAGQDGNLQEQHEGLKWLKAADLFGIDCVALLSERRWAAAADFLTALPVRGEWLTSEQLDAFVKPFRQIMVYS